MIILIRAVLSAMPPSGVNIKSTEHSAAIGQSLTQTSTGYGPAMIRS